MQCKLILKGFVFLDYLLKSSNLICFFGAKSIRVVKFSETLW